jgi:hypothetical protein
MTRQRRRAAQLEHRRPVSALELAEVDVSLLDVIDHVLNQGVVLSGELILGIADVDLIYVKLLALICSADRASGELAQPRAQKRRASGPP